MVEYVLLFAKGIYTTFLVWIVTSILSFCIGSFFGIISSNHYKTSYLFYTIQSYVYIAKGIPAYVHILIAYFFLPSLLHYNFSGLTAGIIALTCASSGYITEIIRGSINRIGQGQWQACIALGYPKNKQFTRIIFPQAFFHSIPSLFGECEQLLKSTALLGIIGITDITKTGMNIISRELNPLSVYPIIACLYLLLSALLYIIKYYIERKTYYAQH